MEKYGFVYIWYDSARSKQNGPDKIKRFYIGCHWGYENDQYICSSNWMRDAYRRRPNDFKRKILETNIETKEETVIKEHKWLSLIKNEELGKRYYNFRNHKFPFSNGYEKTQFKKGQIPWNKDKTNVYSEKILNYWSMTRKGRPGYFKDHKHTQEAKDKVSEANKGNIAWNKGLSPSEETLEKMKPTQFKLGQEAWNKGLSPSEETRKIWSEQRKGRVISEETKKKLSEAHKGHEAWNKGKGFSEEEKVLRHKESNRLYAKRKRERKLQNDTTS